MDIGTSARMAVGGEVVVYGATGHTGRFVVGELLRRGFVPRLSGRDAARLASSAEQWGGVAVRRAVADDPASLDRALSGAVAVVNCAGPFAVTAGPVIESALRAGVPYVDVAAEIEANASTFADYAARARRAGVPVVPAMAFFGGLADLLATTAMGEWDAADIVHVAYGLSGWHPTAGTRLAGQVSHRRRDGRRVRFADGALRYHDDPPAEQDWEFPQPLGSRRVLAGFTMADAVTIPSHLRVPEVRSYMAVEAAADLASRATPHPAAVDELGRSDQTFVVDVVVRRDGEVRRASARGRDIYAASAPLAVEAVARILSGRTRGVGVLSAGALFDASDFLRALRHTLDVTLDPDATARAGR